MPIDLNASYDETDEDTGEMSSDDLLTVHRIFNFVLQNPDAYPELRDEIGPPLPDKFDPELLKKSISAIEQLLQQNGQGLMRLAEQGQGTDTRLAHINPLEDKILRAYGGSGSINPATGMPQYGIFKKIKKVAKKIADPITEGVRHVAKKVVQSPVGRVALGALAAYYFGPVVAAWIGGGSSAGAAAAGGASGSAPVASPELMSGLSFAGGSGISPSALSLFGGGSLTSGMDLTSLAAGAGLSNPSAAPSLLSKLGNVADLTAALGQGLGGLVSYFGSQEALDDAMKLAQSLQSQAQFSPYNISGPGGVFKASGNNLKVKLSPRQKALYEQNQSLGNQRFNELSNFNLNDYVSNYVNWARRIARPYERRAEESLNSTLLNAGMLGSEAGARRYGEFNMNRNAADLQRLIAGETLGANRYNQLNNMWNSSNQNMMNLMNAPLDTAKLGLLAGQARSGAATNAAQFPWLVGQEQAGQTAGFWNQLGGSLANAWQGMFGNTGSNLANYTNYTVSPYMSGQYTYV